MVNMYYGQKVGGETMVHSKRCMHELFKELFTH